VGRGREEKRRFEGKMEKLISGREGGKKGGRPRLLREEAGRKKKRKKKKKGR